MFLMTSGTLAAADARHLLGLKFGDEALRSENTVMHLQLLNNTDESGAVCLDGTRGGFYFSPATDPENALDWQIYFQGGGWCYDEMDCWGRSFGNLGSSEHWSSTGSMDGLFSSDCGKNPEFCNFNRVWLVYCDGNSFSGNREQPVVVRGKPLFFRGKRIIDATLEALTQPLNAYGLQAARNVLLTGCSAGGLATYLHTDYVYERLRALVPGLTRFKAAPISGFFLEHETVDGRPVYIEEMKSIFQLANSSSGVNAACIAAHTRTGDTWRCNFAEHAFAHTNAPILPLNSALDSWQTTCIYTARLAPGFPNQTGTENGECGNAPLHWSGCAHDPESCDVEQIERMNSYMDDFETALMTAKTLSKPGNGAFIHSCHTHCEAQTSAFWTFAVNNVTMEAATARWWRADVSEPAVAHTYSPCRYHSRPDEPYKCNPTC